MITNDFYLFLDSENANKTISENQSRLDKIPARASYTWALSNPLNFQISEFYNWSVTLARLAFCPTQISNTFNLVIKFHGELIVELSYALDSILGANNIDINEICKAISALQTRQEFIDIFGEKVFTLKYATSKAPTSLTGQYFCILELLKDNIGISFEHRLGPVLGFKNGEIYSGIGTFSAQKQANTGFQIQTLYLTTSGLINGSLCPPSNNFEILDSICNYQTGELSVDKHNKNDMGVVDFSPKNAPLSHKVVATNMSFIWLSLCTSCDPYMTVEWSKSTRNNGSPPFSATLHFQKSI